MTIRRAGYSSSNGGVEWEVFGVLQMSLVNMIKYKFNALVCPAKIRAKLPIFLF